MSGPVDVAGDQLRAIVERIENIEGEIKELTEAKKEIFQEAKGNGFDVKVLRDVIRVRKQDPNERDEREDRSSTSIFRRSRGPPRWRRPPDTVCGHRWVRTSAPTFSDLPRDFRPPEEDAIETPRLNTKWTGEVGVASLATSRGSRTRTCVDGPSRA